MSERAFSRLIRGLKTSGSLEEIGCFVANLRHTWFDRANGKPRLSAWDRRPPMHRSRGETREMKGAKVSAIAILSLCLGACDF
jgi:hypothetical protein